MTIEYGTPKSTLLLSKYLFLSTTQKQFVISKLSSPFPKGKKPEMGKMYTSNLYPVVECHDLQKGAGAEVKFQLRGPTFGKPFKGHETFEGKGKKMPWSEAKLKLGFSSFPVYAGDAVDQQVTIHDLYNNAKDAAIFWAKNFTNEASIVHLYGSRGFENRMNWSVPLASDPDFVNILDNPVMAPSRNRHFRVDGDSLSGIADAGGGVLDIASTDRMTLASIAAMVTENEESTFPVMGSSFTGDDMGVEKPVGTLFVSERVYDEIKKSNSSEYATAASEAITRRNKQGQHIIFQAAPLLWKNCLVIIQPKPIRFYPGDAIKYCADITSETESEVTVPTGAGWQSGADPIAAVDRSIFVGAMAMGKIIGGHTASKFSNHKKLSGFLWSEKWLNHDTRLEVAAMMLQSFGKFRFDLPFSTVVQPTDYGVAVLDSVVSLPLR
ncbi:MAG: phage capsid family protein [Candidatus Methanospirareceae archaeon]